MHLIITMALGNAAMQDDDGQPSPLAVADLLGEVAGAFRYSTVTALDGTLLKDANGATVGRITVESS